MFQHVLFRVAGALLALLGLGGVASAAPAAATPACAPDLAARIQHTLEAYRARTHAPGIAAAFYDHGATCLFALGEAGGRGGAVTPDTEFAMGSVEKTFNATLLALAIARGKATIDDPAARYLVAGDGARVHRNAPFARVTLRNLVTHTSALPRQPPGARPTSKTLFVDQPLPATVIRFLDTWRPKYAPGTKYAYSNFGFVLAGEAAVNLDGGPYTRLLAQELTRPLGMMRTGMFCQTPAPDCAENIQRNGKRGQLPVGLWTTARDMLRYLQANLGVLDAPRMLARALEIAHQELFRADADHAIGMAWERWHRGDNLLVSKDGEDSGFNSWVGFEPRRQIGVAVLSNGGDKPKPGALGKQLLALAAAP
ncbi:MAG: serine hydrolase [Proteobacteria bacterium]|nr:serine hydrolase [Pseudomonadota bacterium]